MIWRDTKKLILPPLFERGFVHAHIYLIDNKYINLQIFNTTEIRLILCLTVDTSVTYPCSLQNHPYVPVIFMQELISISHFRFPNAVSGMAILFLGY